MVRVSIRLSSAYRTISAGATSAKMLAISDMIASVAKVAAPQVVGPAQVLEVIVFARKGSLSDEGRPTECRGLRGVQVNVVRKKPLYNLSVVRSDHVPATAIGADVLAGGEFQVPAINVAGGALEKVVLAGLVVKVPVVFQWVGAVGVGF